MAKVKLTKNELKVQKDALKMFKRYLPTLILKKQQLQIEIRKVKLVQADLRKRKTELDELLKSWVAVFAEDVGLDGSLIKVKYINTGKGNIAGVTIPVFEGAEFEKSDYDLFFMPLWVDKGVVKLKEVMLIDMELDILDEQVRLLEKELRTTTQRVNLFEKIKIPETMQHIKKISVYLGDQQTAAVVRGKMAKGKIIKEGGAA